MLMLCGQSETYMLERLPFLFSSHVIGLQGRTRGAGMGRQPDRRRGMYKKKNCSTERRYPLFAGGLGEAGVINKQSSLIRVFFLVKPFQEYWVGYFVCHLSNLSGYLFLGQGGTGLLRFSYMITLSKMPHY